MGLICKLSASTAARRCLVDRSMWTTASDRLAVIHSEIRESAQVERLNPPPAAAIQTTRRTSLKGLESAASQHRPKAMFGPYIPGKKSPAMRGFLVHLRKSEWLTSCRPFHPCRPCQASPSRPNPSPVRLQPSLPWSTTIRRLKQRSATHSA